MLPMFTKRFLLLSLAGSPADWSTDISFFRSHLLKFARVLLTATHWHFQSFVFSLSLSVGSFQCNLFVCIPIIVRTESQSFLPNCVHALCVVITSSIFCNNQMAIRFISLHFTVTCDTKPFFFHGDFGD